MYFLFIFLATLNITSFILLLIALVNIGVSDMRMISDEVRLAKISASVCLVSSILIYLAL